LAILSLGTERSAGERGSIERADTDTALVSGTSQVATIVFGSVLREALRESDIVTYIAAHSQYAILLTESTKAQAQSAIERITALYSRRTPNHLRAGTAEFPRDALTLEELITTAQKAWEGQGAGQSSLEVKGMLNGHRVGSQEQSASRRAD
jgi:hypothetical protein